MVIDGNDGIHGVGPAVDTAIVMRHAFLFKFFDEPIALMDGDQHVHGAMNHTGGR